MAPVAVALEVGVVFVEPAALARGEVRVAAAHAFLEHALAGLVLRDDVRERGALGRGIFGVRVVVVKARAIREHEIAFDLGVREVAPPIEFEVCGLIRVLPQFRREEAARVLMRIFGRVVPLHQRAVLGVAAHDGDALAHHVHIGHTVHGDSILGFDSEDASHVRRR